MQVDTSRDEAEKARAYLIRNVIVPLHPTCVPLPDLMGICTQVDNITAGLKAERDAATARAEAAEAVADHAVGRLEDLLAEGATLTAQRDAATAERDRMRAALEKAAIAAEVESAGHAIAIIEAALAAAKDARHD